jgi:hypothetical protein
VTRHTRRAKVDELVDELAVGAAMRLRCKTGDIHGVVKAVVEYLTNEYPSQDLYIPATLTPPTYPVADIQKAAASGASIRAICKRYRISRKTYYRILGEDAPTT